MLKKTASWLIIFALLLSFCLPIVGATALKNNAPTRDPDLIIDDLFFYEERSADGTYILTSYKNVTAKASDGRTSTQGGETFYGSAKKNGVWINDQIAYANYYPEFISKKDSAVATWFYQDFWADTFGVNWPKT